MSEPSRSRAVRQPRLQQAVWIATGGACVLGLAGAIRLAWVCDDAFISYRYAKHLADGLGLVYNAGERVEGYSNFLWTLLVSGAVRLGGEPILWSQVTGIACYAGTIALLFRTSIRLARDCAAGALVLPVAAVSLSLHYHARVFATGGLETALFALLATATTVSAIEAEGPADHLVVGFLGVLAALVRPDGALFLFVAVLRPFHDLVVRRNVRPLLSVTVPALVLYAPYLTWKMLYYGELLPNTFYAKAAYLPYYRQGVRYLGLYFQRYWVLALGVAGPAWLLLRQRNRTASDGGAWTGRRAPALLLVACVLYLTFVARVGGDFMFARFCIPVTPLLFLGIESVLTRYRSRVVRLVGAGVVAFATWASVSPAPIAIFGNPTGIVEERSFYPDETIREARRLGSEIREITAGLPTTVAIYGSQAMLAYYAELPRVIEAHTGLTDREIARAPVGVRRRVGHEKAASLDDLRRRGVDFVVSFGFFHPTSTSMTRLRLGRATGTLVTYRRTLLDALRLRQGVEIPDFESFLDDYIAHMGDRSPEELERDYLEFKAYYFDASPDPVRQAPFLRALGAEGAP